MITYTQKRLLRLLLQSWLTRFKAVFGQIAALKLRRTPLNDNSGRISVVSCLHKRGFSLVEIIVSTIVMTMLMVSVIAYIQYGGQIWQAGYSKISAINYMRMANELIRKDLQRATNISQPAAMLGGNPTPTSMLRYSTADAPGTYTISIDNTMLIRHYANGAASSTIHIGRNASTFSAIRISTWTLQIHMQFRSDVAEEDGTFSIIASDTFTFMAPGAN